MIGNALRRSRSCMLGAVIVPLVPLRERPIRKFGDFKTFFYDAE